MYREQCEYREYREHRIIQMSLIYYFDFDSDPKFDPNVIDFHMNLQQSLDSFFKPPQYDDNDGLVETISECVKSVNEYDRLCVQFLFFYRKIHRHLTLELLCLSVPKIQ